jgi:hypothetical protein
VPAGSLPGGAHTQCAAPGKQGITIVLSHGWVGREIEVEVGVVVVWGRK